MNGVGEKSGDSAGTFVSMGSIWKFFGGVAVLKGVDIDLRAGEVHALLGGNGSGKSTLMKILSGAYVKDGGSIVIGGREVSFTRPESAHEAGVYLVPQEPKVFPNMSVLENVICGMREWPSVLLPRVAEFARDLGFEASLSEEAASLSIANQQLVEIIRGLVREAKVLILDEPTSTLTFREVRALFDRVRTLTAKGIGVFFISHRLNEVLEISDRVSVLRDGSIVFTKRTGEVGSKDLIRAMMPASDSRDPGEPGVEAERENLDFQSAPTVLEVRNLSGEGFFGVNFTVRAGEVLGLAGVVGAGRTELARAILGLDPFAAGEVFVSGRRLDRRSPLSCLAGGIGYVPEDRHMHGIFLDLPAVRTMTAGILGKLGRPIISGKRERAAAGKYMDDLKIKASSSMQLSRTLSGGNQQKVVLAKILSAGPRLVILDEPTRGVDAKARLDVYRLIRSLRRRGIGILLISSDLAEVIQESDRILVMHCGRVEADFPRSGFDPERITAASFGLGVPS